MLELDAERIVWTLPAEARREKPLLILMHGRGSNEHDLMSLVGAVPSPFAVASLRAPIEEGFGWSWFPPDGDSSGDPRPEDADAAADAVLAWLRGLDPSPRVVGTLGFSQGGAMAVHLMRRDPYRFAFAVNLSGFVVRGDQHGDEVLAQRRPPVFWGRGTEDPLFTWELSTRTASWLTRHSSVMTGHYLGLGHQVSPEELRDVTGFLEGRLASAPPQRMTAAD